jgi:Mce-associated membrane protein
MTALQARRGAADAAAAEPAPTDWRRDPAVRLAGAVALAALLACLVFAVMWWNAANGSAARSVAARDDALGAARQIAVNLQTLDFTTADKGLGLWEASTTGPLHDEFQKNHAQYADEIRKAQTSTRARIIDVALSDLDAGAGTAKVLAAVDVTSTQLANGGPGLPFTKQVRIQLDLVRTPDNGWKASAARPIGS